MEMFQSCRLPETLSGYVVFTLFLQVSRMACVEGGEVAKGEIWVSSMVILMVQTILISWLPYAGLTMLVVHSPDVKIHPLVATVPV